MNEFLATLEQLFAWPIGLYIGAGLALFLLATFWRIFARTGNPGALSLLMLVPGLNLLILLLLAFGTWPIERELRAIRRSRV